MASTVTPAADPPVRSGVAPLRVGQGRSFLLRRMHSLSGVFPVGFYLIEHFFSNAFATNGPWGYANQVKFLTSLPFVFILELLFIWIPILYHALYGFWVWYRGEANVADYPWTGNWLYSAQRWTGGIAFVFMVFHTWEMRFTGVSLFHHPGAAFGKVQSSLENPWVLAFYVVGIVAASWHFAYGLWLFSVKWGLVAGEGARRRLGYACFGVAVMFIAVGLLVVRAFFNPQWADAPTLPPGTDLIEAGKFYR